MNQGELERAGTGWRWGILFLLWSWGDMYITYNSTMFGRVTAHSPSKGIKEEVSYGT